MGNRIGRGFWTTGAGNNSCFAPSSLPNHLSLPSIRRSSTTNTYIFLLAFQHFAFVSPFLSRLLSRILPRADRYKLQNAVGDCFTQRLVETAAVFPRHRCRRRSFLETNTSFAASLPRNVCLLVPLPPPAAEAMLRKFSQERREIVPSGILYAR